MKVISVIKKEWFLVGMVLAILLAALFPNVGKSDGVLHLDIVTTLGIALIFFLHGIGLSPSAIKQGLKNWRLHILVQCMTFVAYPLLWLIFGHGLQAIFPAALAFGFSYLFALPSTISSSVAMTSVAKGNIPGAIFNASLSSVLGVIITPFFVQIFMGASSANVQILATIIAIAKMLLLPMIVGQLVRPILIHFMERHKSVVNKVDKVVILLIVFNAFSNSVVQHIWSNFSVFTLVLAMIVCTIVLLAIATLIPWLSRKLNFNTEDEISALFCGTKKSLAAGVPMAKVIFGTNPHLGMILLPIMLYHPIQIFYCAVLANRYAARFNSAPLPK
ncbi:bile acid:sodium symporter [Vibrio sp. S4M6]|uniref:bile acid:sodium symporter family protein n=1 Tax=Vibrio sinus TaxID=2946865 RepID=UPI00202A2735|nr:bile acid:sodium symporter family protein [Vibrio sinus]MCL9782432.1 bile acid:sodium symporter [Vibrio sinus]